MNEQSHSTNSANRFEIWFNPTKDGKSLMEHLYNRLDGAYPHKWRSNFPCQEAIDNWSVSWAEAFEEEGISPADVKIGLKACRSKHDWPPSCAEFIKSCKQTTSLNTMKAYYEAISGLQARNKGDVGTWSHPAIFYATVGLVFDLLNQTYSQIKERWEMALENSMAIGHWEPIPKPALALPAPGRGELSRENAAKMLQELGAGNVLKKPNHNGAWYKKILEREKRGDKTLTHIQIIFAHEAARNHGAKNAQ